jgi:N-terminal 7TM region of histidine kinase/PAS domain
VNSPNGVRAGPLIVSLIVPYGFNLLYNFDVGPFGRIDLTPFLLVGSCLVLVWGLFRFRLLGIRPVARGLVFETISQAVVVLDPLQRVVDANPPAERLLGLPVADAIGRPLAELPPEAAEAVRNPGTGGNGLPDELRVVAYRIVQEALANVRAHAKASRVAVRLEEADGGLPVPGQRRRRRLPPRPGRSPPRRPPRPHQHARAGRHGRRLVPHRQRPRHGHHRRGLGPPPQGLGRGSRSLRRRLRQGRIPCLSGRSSRRRGPGRCR